MKEAESTLHVIHRRPLLSILPEKKKEYPFPFIKVKVVPYTFVRRGVPVREDTYAEPSACEVGWPVPFHAAFISPVFPLSTHMLLGEQ